eukprot:COSAG06_NODE_21430_length_757_cov_0.784195_1_plen_133_part_00
MDRAEGPNEHDLTLLDFGQVLAVVRLDAGDGLASHPYMPYYYTISLDGGRTWPEMQPMPGTGCARPRLLQLGGGYAPLLMSGGRMKNNGSDDNLLWVVQQVDRYEYCVDKQQPDRNDCSGHVTTSPAFDTEV